MELKEAVGDVFHVALAFDGYAFSLIDLDEPRKAALILGAAVGLWTLMKAEPGPLWSDFRRRSVEALVTAMGEEPLAEARATGASLSAAEALLVIKGERPAPAAPARRSPLTNRELQVAHLVAQGMSNRQIAEKLIISKRTADSHLEHILTKLGFISRAQIAAWAATTDRPDD